MQASLHRLLVSLALTLGALLQAQPRYDLRLTVTTHALAIPGGPGGKGYAFASGADGTLYLLRASAATDGASDLLLSRFDAASGAWSEFPKVARVRLADSDIRLAAGAKGRLAASWTERTDAGTRAMYAWTRYAGHPWSAPAAVSADVGDSAAPVLAEGDDGRWECLWLAGTREPRLLYSRVLPAPAGAAKVLASPVSYSAPSLATFADGSALAAFRDESDEHARDPWAVRLEEDGRLEPTRVGRENWISKDPSVPAVNLASAGPLAAMAWYTGSDGERRILVSTTPDAGLRWTGAQRCDLGRPAGPVAIALLEDGTQLVVWVENPGDDESLPGGVYLRRYAPNGASVMPALLARLPETGVQAVWLRVLEDGRTAPAKLFVEWEEGGGGLSALSCTLPGAAELEELDRTCKCGPGSLPGFAIRGRILSVDAAGSRLTIAHEGVPGLFRKGRKTVRIDPALVRTLGAGREFVGRIDRKGDDWWLSDLRLFAQ